MAALKVHGGQKTRENQRAGNLYKILEAIGTLGISAVETTDWVLIDKNVSKIVGDIISDVSGTLEVQFSPDASTVTGTTGDIPITGGAATPDSSITVCTSNDWVRFKYTNGGTGQSSFIVSLFARAA